MHMLLLLANSHAFPLRTHYFNRLLGSGANYTLYGADIHALAGQTAELDFTLLGNVDINTIFLDSIQFSSQPIPEPGVYGLAALGALLLGWRGLGRRR
jgi:hypothetical protein